MAFTDPTRKREWHKTYDQLYYQNNKEHIKKVRLERRRELSRWLRELKAEYKCVACPEDFWACIEFHHEDGDTKEYTLADMANKGLSKRRILAELAKCIPMCANCHRKHHFQDVAQLG